MLKKVLAFNNSANEVTLFVRKRSRSVVLVEAAC